jgi:ComF family protein
MKCGKPVRRAEQEFCHDCTVTTHHFDRGIALWLHKPPVSNSIYQFKYHNQRAFGKYYAREMSKRFKNLIREWDPNCIIPIPLHKSRKRKRGYNQAEILAKELGKRCHLLVDTKSVVRRVDTRPQKELNNKQRKRNLNKAFYVTKHWKKWKNVLLIDDIYTTGNTIDSVAELLMKKGAEKVYFLSISIGQGF